MKILVRLRVFCFLPVCLCRHKDAVKDRFSDRLYAMAAKFPASPYLIPYGECNDHWGSTGSGNEEVHDDCMYDILRLRGPMTMHWRMTCSSVTCALRNVKVSSLHTDQVKQHWVISKEPLQACFWCDDYIYRWRGGCSAASTSKRHFDWCAAPNQALIHTPYLSKIVEMARTKLTRIKVSLSEITRERVMLRTETTIVVTRVSV